MKTSMHIVSEKTIERGHKLIWPIVHRNSKTWNHLSLYIGNATPIVKGKNLKVLKSGSRFSKKVLNEIALHLEETNPDVIHFHDTNIIPYIMAVKPRISALKVATVSELPRSGLSGVWDNIRHQWLRWIDCVVFSSALLESYFISHGMPPSKSRVVFDGVAIPKGQNNRSNEYGDKEIYIVPGTFSSSRLEWVKALKEVSEELRPSFLVPQADYFSVRSKTNSLKIAKNLRQGTEVDLKQGRPLAALVGRPVKSSNLWIQEFMHRGVPILAYRESYLEEFLIPGMNGYLFRKGDTSIWANFYRTALNNSQEMIKVSKFSRQLASNLFTPISWVQENEKIYSEFQS